MGVLIGALAGVASFQVIMKQLKGNKKMNIDRQLHVEQNIPGRLRAYSDVLKNKEVRDALQIQLVRIDGIHKVALNEVTGSILVQYDKTKIDHSLLVPALLKLLGIDFTKEGKHTSAIMNEVQIVNGAMNRAVLDKTNGLLDVDTLVPLGFIGLAVNEIIKTGTVGTPPPITLLNWAYMALIFRGNRG